GILVTVVVVIDRTGLKIVILIRNVVPVVQVGYELVVLQVNVLRVSESFSVQSVTSSGLRPAKRNRPIGPGVGHRPYPRRRAATKAKPPTRRRVGGSGTREGELRSAKALV